MGFSEFTFGHLFPCHQVRCLPMSNVQKAAHFAQVLRETDWLNSSTGPSYGRSKSQKCPKRGQFLLFNCHAPPLTLIEPNEWSLGSPSMRPQLARDEFPLVIQVGAIMDNNHFFDTLWFITLVDRIFHAKSVYAPIATTRSFQHIVG